MKYFVLPICLYFFSELLGNVIANKYRIKSFVFNGLFGFVIILSLVHIVSFVLVTLNVYFIILLITTILLFAALLFFIIKNRKYIQFKISIVDIVVVIALIGLQVFFDSRSNIGSLYRYDTVTYGNLISDTIYSSSIGLVDLWNGFSRTMVPGYLFQGYYKLASVMYYLMNGICNVLGKQFFYFSQHAWMYTLLLYIFISEMVVNFIHEFKIKKGLIHLLIFLFFIFFMGNYYWNSEQAYLGNSFRMIMISYCLIYINEFFKTKQNVYLIILCIYNYANVACANSNTLLVLILTLFVWLFIEDTKETTRWILVSVFIPLINCLYQIIGYNIVILIIVSIAFGLLFVFAVQINKIVNVIKLKKWLPLTIAVFLITSSFIFTKDLFNLDAFLHSIPLTDDMAWVYTDFSTIWRSIANISFYVLMAFAIIKNWNSTIIKIVVFIAIIIFNPFSMPIEVEYDIVFYRNIDIIINYFTLMLGFKALEDLDVKESIKSCSIVTLSLVFAFIGYNQYQYHPPEGSFENTEDFSYGLKMNIDEANALAYIKKIVLLENLQGNKIISSIYQLRVEMPYMKTLYNRSKMFNGLEEDYELYKIFFPDDYYGDPYAPKNPDYEHIYTLLNESDYIFVIQSNRKMLYDEKSDRWYSLVDLLNEYYTPVYKNKTISIYRIH